MRSFLRYTLLALPLLGGVIAEEPSTQTSEASTSIYANAHEAFQDLLNVLPEESLQAALNSLTKFKAGVFESHRRGVEHVHNSSPALATKLIVAAVQDLKKRQVASPSNGTTPVVVQTSSTPDAQSSAAQSSAAASSAAESAAESSAAASSVAAAATTAEASSSRPVLIPVEVTTVNSAGSTVVQTSSVYSEVTASVQVTVTLVTTNAAGSTVTATTQEVRPAVIHTTTTTDSAGKAVTATVTSAAIYAPTAGEVLTTTNAQGSTFLTTYTPGGGRVSSVRLVTTTDAQGNPQTLTSITYVDPTAVAGGGTGTAAEGTVTSTGKPSVQSGSAGRNSAVALGAVGMGAFAVFF